MIWFYLPAVATGIIAVVGWVITKEVSLWLKGVIVFLILIAVTAQIFVARTEIKEKKASRYSGVLKGAPITILSAGQEVYPQLKLGDSRVFFNWQGSKGKPMFKIFEDNDITFWIDNDRLRLSTKIRNKNGEMIAQLIGNEWKVKPEKLWGRNYSDNALEIVDEAGDVVLQVILEEDHVQFAAKMYSSNGQGVGLGSTEDPKIGVVGVIEIAPPGQPLKLFIEPIFKYPSELHLGELKEDN